MKQTLQGAIILLEFELSKMPVCIERTEALVLLKRLKEIVDI